MVSFERRCLCNPDIKFLCCMIFHADSNNISFKRFLIMSTCKTVFRAKIAISRMRRPRAKLIRFLKSAQPKYPRTQFSLGSDNLNKIDRNTLKRNLKFKDINFYRAERFLKESWLKVNGHPITANLKSEREIQN